MNFEPPDPIPLTRPVADELLKAGVPREDIVLAFRPENVRHLTDFAVR